MKLQIISWDGLNTIKENLDLFLSHFSESDNQWLEQEFGHSPFIDTRYEMPEIKLDMSFPSNRAHLTDAANVQEFYDKMRFLSNSHASDERLWAGLCLGRFWEYTKYRWDVHRKCTHTNIEQHYFFAYGPRRSLTRNALSRLWWIGRLTYDSSRSDPYELTKFVCENSDYIMHIIERSTSNNPAITQAFVGALMEARDQGCLINTDTVGELSKYLNLLGGTYLLDCLQHEVIKEKILLKAKQLTK